MSLQFDHVDDKVRLRTRAVPLIPDAGKSEWRFMWEKGASLNPKQPYYFQLKDEEPFAFAGIWDKWQGDESAITSCAIITTRANELLAPIHVECR